jgi:CheY-like chemotaxis protein
MTDAVNTGAQPTARAAGPGPRVRTVLVVENDAMVRRLAETILGRGGYQVLTALDGRQAVDVYRSTPIDVVLMDLYMPVLSGVDAMGELRRIDPQVRVVLTSGARPNLPEPAPTVFLNKPYSPADLLAAVAAALPPER